MSLLATVVAVWSLGLLQTEPRSAEEPVVLIRVRLFDAEPELGKNQQSNQRLIIDTGKTHE